MENSNSSKRPPMFTNHALLMLILPLIIEQFLAVAVGMADTAMVTGVGEAADTNSDDHERDEVRSAREEQRNTHTAPA